jgi:glutathione S-transferase
MRLIPFPIRTSRGGSLQRPGGLDSGDRHHTVTASKRRKTVEYVAIVTSLALIQAFVFAWQVGQQRVRHEVRAPAVHGAPEFDRAFRVHQNTVEQLVIFIPALWIFASYWRADIAAGIGLVFVVSRQVYRKAYIEDPAKRSAGFGVGAAAMTVLMLGGLAGAVMNLL